MESAAVLEQAGIRSQPSSLWQDFCGFQPGNCPPPTKIRNFSACVDPRALCSLSGARGRWLHPVRRPNRRAPGSGGGVSCAGRRRCVLQRPPLVKSIGIQLGILQNFLAFWVFWRFLGFSGAAGPSAAAFGPQCGPLSGRRRGFRACGRGPAAPRGRAWGRPGAPFGAAWSPLGAIDNP